ncbi:hypothetical protein DICPUDRAFT_154946 [Dictyostelium purpureum]|uniref:Exonuclease domain-containing protein n=1 Tax=Dictyostelium purpureum TaxID=5786 RepID=F0ZSN7_DICPU|nr:uncharacterized protein DICPUDRAFT_154946 [Dictyostelium purpureum]EGC33039.1 hypothetical protein DICPUDRAFT_154946 [Dictyostelium purpureum]|eukprot:XP_003290428.1 hypothetical protein DICPUDRAFT_154946 [Dictyostelium purpureum]
MYPCRLSTSIRPTENCVIVFDLPQLSSPAILFLDTETTGLSVATDEIIEVSIIDLYDGSHFYKLINPTATVSSTSASIHESGAYIIAHNEKFDRGILASQIGKNAASVPSMFPLIVFIDSIPIFKLDEMEDIVTQTDLIITENTQKKSPVKICQKIRRWLFNEFTYRILSNSKIR